MGKGLCKRQRGLEARRVGHIRYLLPWIHAPTHLQGRPIEAERNNEGMPEHMLGTRRVKRREASAFEWLSKTNPLIFASKTSSTVSFLKKLGVY